LLLSSLLLLLLPLLPLLPLLLLLQVSARDQDSKWLTALTLLDDDSFIAADNGHNLVGLEGFVG
jgi:hypothetical protein